MHRALGGERHRGGARPRRTARDRVAPRRPRPAPAADPHAAVGDAGGARRLPRRARRARPLGAGARPRRPPRGARGRRLPRGPRHARAPPRARHAVALRRGHGGPAGAHAGRPGAARPRRVMARLVLGPLLRYAGETEATIWVETDAPCEVEVLDCREPAFCVEGHHYALVHCTGLEPASTTPYDVRLDGEKVWPEDDEGFPPSVIRTHGQDGAFRIAWGSC